MPSNTPNRKPEYVSLDTHRKVLEAHGPTVQRDLVTVTTRTRMEPELTLDSKHRRWKEPKKKPEGAFVTTLKPPRSFELVDNYSVQATQRCVCVLLVG